MQLHTQTEPSGVAQQEPSSIKTCEVKAGCHGSPEELDFKSQIGLLYEALVSVGFRFGALS